MKKPRSKETDRHNAQQRWKEFRGKHAAREEGAREERKHCTPGAKKMEATRARGGHGRGRIERQRRGSRETSQREESIAQAAERAMLARDARGGNASQSRRKQITALQKARNEDGRS